MDHDVLDGRRICRIHARDPFLAGCMNPSRRVVVTGFGSINPLGVSAEESFKRLLCGHSGLNFYRPTQWSFDKKFADILSKWVVGQIPSSWTTISVRVFYGCLISNDKTLIALELESMA